jgi:hypothetical protein
MRWEDEIYVRWYKRNTPEWSIMRWTSRGLFGLIMREVDRAGILELGKVGLKAVAVAVRAPWEEIEAPLAELLADGCIVHHAEARLLVIPNFIAAQEANASDKARQRTSRERARDLARAKSHGVTIGSPPVTSSRDEASRNVTGRHEVPPNGHAKLNREEEDQNSKPTPPNLTGSKGGRTHPSSDDTSPEAQRAEPATLEAPKAEHPEALTIRIFEELFRKRYKRDFQHTSFGHPKSDEWSFIRIAKLAATKPDPERWLRHVWREYLRDDDRFLAKQAHAPRFLEGQLNKYGDPKKPKPAAPAPKVEPEPVVTRPFVPLQPVSERGPVKVPSTEAELRAKAERDKQRLAEAERLAAGEVSK